MLNHKIKNYPYSPHRGRGRGSFKSHGFEAKLEFSEVWWVGHKHKISISLLVFATSKVEAQMCKTFEEMI